MASQTMFTLSWHETPKCWPLLWCQLQSPQQERQPMFPMMISFTIERRNEAHVTNQWTCFRGHQGLTFSCSELQNLMILRSKHVAVFVATHFRRLRQRCVGVMLRILLARIPDVFHLRVWLLLVWEEKWCKLIVVELQLQAISKLIYLFPELLTNVWYFCHMVSWAQRIARAVRSTSRPVKPGFSSRTVFMVSLMNWL